MKGVQENKDIENFIEEQKKSRIDQVKQERTKIEEEVFKGNCSKAEEMFLNSPYQEEEAFFYVYLKILYAQNRVEEMMKIFENTKYADSIHVQGEYLKYLYLKKDYTSILTRYERLKHYENPKIFSYYVRAISKTKGIAQALYLIESRNWKEEIHVEALKIHLLRVCGSLEEALDLCQTSVNRKKLKIVAEEIYLLSKLGRYEEAYQIVMHSNYKDYLIIKTSLISVLCEWYISTGRKNTQLLEKAERCIDKNLLQIDRRHFKAYMFFVTVSQSTELAKREENDNEEVLREKEKEGIIAKQLGYIYEGTFDMEVLENANIDQFQKDILVLAYLHKNYKKEAFRVVKRLKEGYKESREKVKIFNRIQAIIEQKNSLFDITLYSNLLRVKIEYSNNKGYLEKNYVKRKN
jgi:hypothetical protein